VLSADNCACNARWASVWVDILMSSVGRFICLFLHLHVFVLSAVEWQAVQLDAITGVFIKMAQFFFKKRRELTILLVICRRSFRHAKLWVLYRWRTFQGLQLFGQFADYVLLLDKEWRETNKEERLKVELLWMTYTASLLRDTKMKYVATFRRHTWCNVLLQLCDCKFFRYDVITEHWRIRDF